MDCICDNWLSGFLTSFEVHVGISLLPCVTSLLNSCCVCDTSFTGRAERALSGLWEMSNVEASW